ncbi:hypothetical protein WS68_04750 [Burkholderia sp. TSV86]|nr:hypothetical protein WS68_04750 [Burkholderia sp. TSV86]
MKSRYDSKRGLVQYLDFRDASLPAKTRLNTTFVRELIETADKGLDALLDYVLQAERLEADLEDDDRKGEPMDFGGANGLYFWELFFHLPYLVAWRFGNDQAFDQARQWLHYIFDPAMGKKPSVDGIQPPPYWNVRPLVDRGNFSRLLAAPLDPDALAYASPEIYQKAIFISYVSNLISQGDRWYRQLTRDGLTQARVLYNLAVELLGPRPDVSLSSTWIPRTVNTLASAINDELREFEQASDAGSKEWLTLPSTHVGYLRLTDNKYFKAPLNTLMLAHWDAIDARLYNLRHNLTVDGKPLSLPLYAPPADPVALLSQRAQSGTLVSGISAAQLTVPHYRFNAILPRAYNAVSTLSRFGDTLLSLIERADRASQEELQQQQLLDMSSYAITLQQQTIDGLAADRQALEATRSTAQQRHDSYYTLYDENISSGEQLVMDAHTEAQTLTLNYSSGAGNGTFGIGWLLALPYVRRRTNRGVPRYDNGPADEFVGPDEEVLVAERDEHGVTVATTVTHYNDKDLGATYRVTRYFPRIESAFDRIEHWQGERATDDFWLLHGANGQLHCLGKTAAARVANPDHPEQIAEWRIEESVNPFGEHIYYRHVAENGDGVTASNEATRDHSANRYLAEVFYGNRTAATDLYLWDHDDAGSVGWLFSVVLDYGERGVNFNTAPPYTAAHGHTWPLRTDSFSRYQYGFEVRTHRLCRQVLMFHHFPDELKQDHTLVRRLLLTYRESAVLSQLTQARILAYETDGTVQSLAPLEFGYSTFDPKVLTDSYRVFDGVAELNDGVHYQMVDLYGDGLPGVLFRHSTGWRYRAPIRREIGTDNVAYGDWQALPAVPGMQPVRLALMDIDGDARLDWLVAQPDMGGYFSFKEGNQWSDFIPFNALPPEFLHPQAQLADLVGAGLSTIRVARNHSAIRIQTRCPPPVGQAATTTSKAT